MEGISVKRGVDEMRLKGAPEGKGIKTTFFFAEKIVFDTLTSKSGLKKKGLFILEETSSKSSIHSNTVHRIQNPNFCHWSD